MIPISIATATFYDRPFEQTLEIIAAAGFEWIELDLYWEKGNWAMAQHLKGWSAAETVRCIERSGLHVSSVHDGGGVLDSPDSALGLVNPILQNTLDQLGYAPEHIVFHAPHIIGAQDPSWWPGIADKIAAELAPYRDRCRAVTVENMPHFEGYTVALTNPQELLAFITEYHLGVTLDTAHYAQLGMDILQAAQTLRDSIKTVHLSDFISGRAHVFVGVGHLNLAGFFQNLRSSGLQTVTLECDMSYPGEDTSLLSAAIIIDRMKLARSRVEGWLGEMPEVPESIK